MNQATKQTSNGSIVPPPTNPEPTAATPPSTIDEIKIILENHCKNLLVRLAEFRAVEEEYKLASRALRDLTGEVAARGRPTNESRRDTIQKPGAQGRTRDILKVINEAPNGLTSRQIANALGMGSTTKGRAKINAALTYAHTGKDLLTRNLDGLYTLTDAGRAYLGGEQASPRKGKPRVVKAPNRTIECLTALSKMPHGGRPREVAMQLGKPDEARQIGIALPGAAKKHFAKSKGGLYTITTQGRNYLAAVNA